MSLLLCAMVDAARTRALGAVPRTLLEELAAALEASDREEAPAESEGAGAR